MSLSRIAAAVGGLLLSRRGSRLAGRHAGKVALATLAWELYQSRRTRTAQAKAQVEPQAKPAPRRRRWSGRSGESR